MPIDEIAAGKLLNVDGVNAAARRRAWADEIGNGFGHNPALLQGLLGQSMDVAVATSAITPTAATIYIARIQIPVSITITNVHLIVATAGTNYSNAQVAIYQSDGKLAFPFADGSLRSAQSVVLASGGTNTFGTTGFKTLALSEGAMPVSGGGYVYAAVHLGVNSATAVQFQAATPTALIINAGLTTATARFATQAGHATNPLGSIGPLVPASASFASTPIWFGIS